VACVYHCLRRFIMWQQARNSCGCNSVLSRRLYHTVPDLNKTNQTIPRLSICGQLEVSQTEENQKHIVIIGSELPSTNLLENWKFLTFLHDIGQLWNFREFNHFPSCFWIWISAWNQGPLSMLSILTSSCLWAFNTALMAMNKTNKSVSPILSTMALKSGLKSSPLS